MNEIDKYSLNITEINKKELRKLFPNVFIEDTLDFEALKNILGIYQDEHTTEKYQFNWNGKKESIKLAQQLSVSTLRPKMEKSLNWDKTKNLYIEGDNLEVLKQLQKTYYGKIQMIYIDPPYNTGNDFVYSDNFKDSILNYKEQANLSSSSNPKTDGKFHTKWLNMMYPRLMLARNLLTKDGVIVISIDDNEVANVKNICNEIFGESNFISQIIIENDSRARPYGSIATTHEYALIYSKSSEIKFNALIDQNKKFSYYDEEGGFDLYELRNRNIDFNIENRPNLYYPFYLNPTNKDENDLYEISLEKKEGFVEVFPQESKGIKTVWRWGKDKASQNLNSVLFGKLTTNGNWQIVKKYRESTYVLNSVWTDREFKSDRGTLEVKKLFNDKKVFDFPKPVALIKRFLELFTSSNDIVLDFFSGSSTTAEAVLQLNAEQKSKRSFIMIQLPEILKSNSVGYKCGYKTICEIAEDRIKLAGEKIQNELKLKENSVSLFDENIEIDIGFKVFSLDSTNIKTWDNKNELTDRSIFDYSEIFKENRNNEDILYEIMLKYGVFDMPVTNVNINGKTMYRIGKRYMLVCLENEVSKDDVKMIAELSPKTVVFKESGFKNDNDKINAEYNLQKAGVEDIKCI